MRVSSSIPTYCSLPLGALALIGGAAIAKFAGSALVGMVVAVALSIALLQWPARRLFLQDLLDDWIFARNYIRGEHSVLGSRLEKAAESLCEAARGGEADEILVVGHSLGAALAIDLLDRALLIDPKLGEGRTRVSFLSIGSSIPSIALHRAATRFRAAVEQVANAPAIFWGEYQALTDVMNFYKVDPVIDMGIKGKSPLIRQVRVKAMLDPARTAASRAISIACTASFERERPAGRLRLILCSPAVPFPPRTRSDHQTASSRLSGRMARWPIYLWRSGVRPSSVRRDPPPSLPRTRDPLISNDLQYARARCFQNRSIAVRAPSTIHILSEVGYGVLPPMLAGSQPGACSLASAAMGGV